MRVRMFIVQVYAYSNNDEIPFIVEKLQKKALLIQYLDFKQWVPVDWLYFSYSVK
jgi:hypothetical protein